MKERLKYEDHPGINISKLKLLEISPRNYINALEEERDEDPDHFLIGTAVEAYACYGKEQFLKNYHILTEEAPTAMLKAFGKALIQGKSEEEAYEIAGYNPRQMGIKKVIEKFERFRPWMHEMQRTMDLKRLTPEQYRTVATVGEELINNPFTMGVFKDSEYQKELYWEEIFGNNFVSCKALPDVFQEFEDKILLTDLKTSSQGIMSFDRTILKYRYDLQAAWYCKAVKAIYDKPCEFQFLAIDIKYKNPPVIYRMSEKAIHAATVGYTAKNGWVCKGCDELLKQYFWHTTTNKWEYPKDIYDNDGIKIVDEL